jgi:hypothetical protein
VADATCRRIEQLIKDQLQKIGTDISGWEPLYRDPTDDRFWELTFPQGEMHGGGPPRLAWISHENARQKYGHLQLQPPNGTW